MKDVMKFMNKKGIMILHIICPIVIGALVYCMVSPNVIFIKRMEDLIGGSVYMPVFRTDCAFLRLLRNYLPDMMWGYSLVFALFCVAGNNVADIWRVFWMAFIFSAVMEAMQKTSFIPGTFDVFGIFAEFLAEVAAIYIIHKLHSREEF